MGKFEKLIWKLRCSYYGRKMAMYVILGDREKANESFNKVLDMVEAYKDIYL